MIRHVYCGSRIRILFPSRIGFFSISDLGVKYAPDPQHWEIHNTNCAYQAGNFHFKTLRLLFCILCSVYFLFPPLQEPDRVSEVRAGTHQHPGHAERQLPGRVRVQRRHGPPLSRLQGRGYGGRRGRQLDRTRALWWGHQVKNLLLLSTCTYMGYIRYMVVGVEDPR